MFIINKISRIFKTILYLDFTEAYETIKYKITIINNSLKKNKIKCDN